MVAHASAHNRNFSNVLQRNHPSHLSRQNPHVVQMSLFPPDNVERQSWAKPSPREDLVAVVACSFCRPFWEQVFSIQVWDEFHISKLWKIRKNDWLNDLELVVCEKVEWIYLLGTTQSNRKYINCASKRRLFRWKFCRHSPIRSLPSCFFLTRYKLEQL